MRGASNVAPMPDHRPRSSYESDRLHYSKAAARSALRNTIGHELRIRYEVPQDALPEILALLMRLNQHHEAEPFSPGYRQGQGWRRVQGSQAFYRSRPSARPMGLALPRLRNG